MKVLVGCTGFVGSNLYEKGAFDRAYHSKNISEAFGTSPDLLIYAGLRAEKYLANHEPQKDMALIQEAEANIKKIHPKKLVLISTVDVFRTPAGADETSTVDTDGLHAYGYHRHQLELWVRQNYPDALIVRLPALFGKNMKKNFIYDYMNVIPFMLTNSKFAELVRREPLLENCYRPLENGFYRENVPNERRDEIKAVFCRLRFCALHFTDSRSRYQFYNLENLWDDLCTVLRMELMLWHPATEPVSVGELYRFLTGEEFVNELDGVPVDYDYRTVYAGLFGGRNGYIRCKTEIMREIRTFVENSLATNIK